MTKIELKEPCPIKMKFNSDGNFFCGQCQKNVVDLTTKTKSEIDALVSNQNFNSCANYLHVYHDGWLGKYQRGVAISRQKINSSKASWIWFLVPFVLFVFFISGCRTRGGAPTYLKQEPTKKENKK